MRTKSLCLAAIAATVAAPQIAAAASPAALTRAYAILPRQGYTGPLLLGPTGPRTPQPRPPVVSTDPNSFAPSDLTYFGGPTLATAGQMLVYVQARPAAVGNPRTFVTALNVSGMQKVLNQYVGSTATRRYPLGGELSYGVSFLPPVLHDIDITYIVDAAAQSNASGGRPGGLGTVIHVLLPRGVSVCMDDDSACYAASAEATGPNVFCGYHAAMTGSDGSTIPYTVVPYQAVDGCRATSSTTLADATANTLAHEIIGAITDPLPGQGWVGNTALNSGYEAGAMCTGAVAPRAFGALTYTIQSWYSNTRHACTVAP